MNIKNLKLSDFSNDSSRKKDIEIQETAGEQNQFQLELNSKIKSMIEIGHEYTDWNEDEVEVIYVFCAMEISDLFYFFFKIGGSIVDRYQINDHLSKNCDVSPDRQFSADGMGLKYLEELKNLFEEDNREKPNYLRISFDMKSSKMDTSFNYDKRLVDSDLISENILDEWMDSLRTE